MSDENTRKLRGQVLRRLRKSRHLSARELAERASERLPGRHLSASSIYAYERGQVMLSAHVARVLADTLRADAAELLVGDPAYAIRTVGTPGLTSRTKPDAAPLEILDVVAQAAILDLSRRAVFLHGNAAGLRNDFPPLTDPAHDVPVLLGPRVERLCRLLRFVEDGVLYGLIKEHESVFNSLTLHVRDLATARDKLEAAWRSLARHFRKGTAELTELQFKGGCDSVAEALGDLKAELSKIIKTTAALEPDRILDIWDAEIAKLPSSDGLQIPPGEAGLAAREKRAPDADAYSA